MPRTKTAKYRLTSPPRLLAPGDWCVKVEALDKSFRWGRRGFATKEAALETADLACKADLNRAYRRGQIEKASARVEAQWKQENFIPKEFVDEYYAVRPSHTSDKAALSAVAEELGTPCGDSPDEDQRYRNLRDRLKRAREYVQRGSPNSTA
jgi:hypothetical protein